MVEKDNAASSSSVEPMAVDPSPTTADPDMVTVDWIKEHVKLIERSCSTKDTRLLAKVIRELNSVRKRLNANVLRTALLATLADGTSGQRASLRDQLLSYVPGSALGGEATHPVNKSQPETEVYMQLLVVLLLLDSGETDKAMVCSSDLVSRVSDMSTRRTVYPLAAKAYFYYSRALELVKGVFDVSVMTFLHTRLQSAIIHHDIVGEATLINIILRVHVDSKQYDRAEALLAKISFPQRANNNESARFCYYKGRITAVQLDYTESHRLLQDALRKAPQTGAIGFKQTVTKFLIVVQLLLGDIPARSHFRAPALRGALRPYFQLTQAVRTGNLQAFNETVANNHERFVRESTYTLIIRLRHNVIKTGVRRISLSYSAITFQEIANKLQLDSEWDAEYIVAKAIKDKVIDGSIDLHNRCLRSAEDLNVYSSGEPTQAYHTRIAFCLDVHNQAVKAMRYPPKVYKELENSDNSRERETQELEEGLDGDIDDDDMM